MKSYLINREVALMNLYEEVFNEFPKEQIIGAVHKLLKDVMNIDANSIDVVESLESVLNKTETFNILMSLFELEKITKVDKGLRDSMSDPSYSQHRTIAISICDMYGSGATSLFGYLDCVFKTYFPNKLSNSFLSKGICGIIASVAESVLTGSVEDKYLDKNIRLLNSRGIEMNEMIDMVFDLQKPYNPNLTKEICKEHLKGVLRKQQSYHTIHLSLLIDTGVEGEVFGEQFLEIVGNDEGLYGVDETVNTSISKLYGSIAFTNFGYLDKAKPGIIGRLDSNHVGNHCNTFADDMVCAIVSATCARLAHNSKENTSKPKT
jgi:phosphatidylglycerophosphatase A